MCHRHLREIERYVCDHFLTSITPHQSGSDLKQKPYYTRRSWQKLFMHLRITCSPYCRPRAARCPAADLSSRFLSPYETSEPTVGWFVPTVPFPNTPTESNRRPSKRFSKICDLCAVFADSWANNISLMQDSQVDLSQLVSSSVLLLSLIYY